MDWGARWIVIWEIAYWQRRVKPGFLVPMILIGERFCVILKMI